MTAMPATKLTVNQSTLRARLRRLAEIESTAAPVLSAYVDLRPDTTGENPAQRAGLTELRDRLREIERSMPTRGPATESYTTDVERLWRLLESDEVRAMPGIAVHACAALEIWEGTGSGIAFDTEVSIGPTANLYQLARLLDEQETAIVAVVDTSTCRLFVTRHGDLIERGGPDEGPEEHTRHDQGGWAQARFQRHIDEQDKRFAGEAAEAIGRLAEREGARRIILAGDERAIGALEGQLPDRVRELVAHVERIDIDAPPAEVERIIAPVLAAIEEADGMSVADRALAGSRAAALGVTGIEPVTQALEMGQIEELVIDDGADELDVELRAELVRLATLTDARVETVFDHEELKRAGGVAATLRYRL